MAETRYADAFRRIVARIRARGVTVVVEPGAYSRTVGAGTSSRKDMLGLDGQTVHHTAGGNNSSDRRVVRDGRPGLRGPLSQFLTETDGTARLIASGYANHAGPSKHRRMGNSYSVGNEIVSRGRGTADFTPAQMHTARVIAEEVAREGAFSTDWVRGHKEEGVPLGRKVDPAFSMTGFRASLGAAPTVPAPTTPEPEEGFLMALTDKQQDDMLAAVARIDVLAQGIDVKLLSREQNRNLYGAVGRLDRLTQALADGGVEAAVRAELDAAGPGQAEQTAKRVTARIAGMLADPDPKAGDAAKVGA